MARVSAAIPATARGPEKGWLPSPFAANRTSAKTAPQAARPPHETPALAGLTAREHDVLRLLARGLTNAEIAAQLVVEPSTIKSHVASLLAKLSLRDRVQAVVFAYENGLIRPGTA